MGRCATQHRRDEASVLHDRGTGIEEKEVAGHYQTGAVLNVDGGLELGDPQLY